MSTIDIVIIVPLIWAAYRGFKKGLIIEVSSLIALGLGVWGAIHFSDYIAEIITGKVEDKYVPLASFTVTFILIVAGVFVLGRILEKFINLIQLKLVNKAAGAGFGIIKVLLIISVILVIINSYDEQLNLIPQEVKDESALYYPLSDFSQTVIPALKENKMFKQVEIPSVNVDSILIDKAIESQIEQLEEGTN